MSTIEEQASTSKGKDKDAKVEVNNQKVTLQAAPQTGLAIKQAAIHQGVQITVEFQLTQKLGKEWVVIGDADLVEVRSGEKFRAVDSDDNS